MIHKVNCPYCGNKAVDIEYLSYHLHNECEGYKKINHYPSQILTAQAKKIIQLQAEKYQRMWKKITGKDITLAEAEQVLKRA